jgi:universal stress protein A
MAKLYEKILLAVDLHDDNEIVLETARDLAELHEAELHVVHVSEPMSMAYAANGVTWGDQVYALEASIKKESEKKLKGIASMLSIPEAQCHFLEGRPASKIHELCEQGSYNLIVLGTHGQSGLQLLLGSTANAVLHGSACDVLAVRI